MTDGKIQKDRFDIAGMNCAACVANVEKAVCCLPGVKNVGVNLLTNSMVAEYDHALISPQVIANAVINAGYQAALHDQNQTKSSDAVDLSKKEMLAIKRRLFFSLVFLLPLVYLGMGGMIGLPLPAFLAGPEKAFHLALAQFLLCIPVIVINRSYFSAGFASLFRFAPNMDSLIAIGSSSAVIYGIRVLYDMYFAFDAGKTDLAFHYLNDLYFESAAMILTLVTLGRTLEMISKGKTRSSIQSLLNLNPKTALVIKDGVEKEVPLEAVIPGDTLIVKPGSQIPLDGTVLEGVSAVDESAFTGEGIPVEKGPGDSVIGATFNTGGYFTMRAEKIGKDTALAGIISLVEEASASKAPVSKLADQISRIFVPAVILLSMITFIVWFWVNGNFAFSLSRAISVLIISCPCALGLATPVAIMVGTGRGAREGILYKNAAALENLCHIKTIVLDKTGTVTNGQPELTDIISFDMRQDQLLALAFGLERYSEHPLAKAIVAQAEKQGIEPVLVSDFVALSGLGIKGNTPNGEGVAGNQRLMASYQIDLTAAKAIPERLAKEGKTPLYFALNGRLAGILAMADLPRPSSRLAVLEMKKRGLNVTLLTGDNALTGEAVRKTTDIDRVIAEVLPQEKEAVIRGLMQSGQKVAMVGDGINDAPALARADIGIAIGAGTDVAIDSADIVLMKSDLGDMVAAYDLSKATLKTIKLSLFWAFFYNVLGIPIAAGVLYPVFGVVLDPMIAAAAMSLSSIFVVLNALRLNAFKNAFKAHLPASLPKSPAKKAISSTAIQTNMNAISMNQKEEIKMSQEKTLYIEGMNCAHCKAAVEKALNALPGVNAKVNLEQKQAQVISDGQVSDEQLFKAVTDAGFELKNQ